MNAQLIETNIDGHDVALSRETIIMLARQAKVTAEELSGPTVLKDCPDYLELRMPDGQRRRIYRIPNDTKYGVSAPPHRDGVLLANLETGKEIPIDEPVMIFRAQDKHALTAIEAYARVVENAGNVVRQMTGPSAAERFMAFSRFQQDHPERVKEPS